MKRATYRRVALVAPLALLGLAFFFNAVHGQRHIPRPPVVRPPSMPKPPALNPNPVIRPPMPNPGLGGPVIEKVWTCSGCGKVIGRNTPFPPGTCPYCQAKIVNGIGPPNTANLPGAGMPGMNPNPGAGMPPVNPNPSAGMPPFNPNPNPGMPGANPNPVMPVVNPPPNPDLNSQTELMWVCNNCGKALTPQLEAPPQRCPHCNTFSAKMLKNVNRETRASSPVLGGPSLVSSSSDVGPSSPSSTPGTSRFNSKVIALVVGIVVIGILALLGGTFLMIYTMKSGSASSEPRRRRRPRRYDDYDD